MANVNRPNGFKPVGTISGSPWSGAVRKYSCDASSGAIFPGDLIKLEADGKAEAAAAGDTQLIGVCVGIVVDRDVAATEHPGYKPATTAGEILVCIAPDALYEAQEDGDTTDLALTDIGANVDMVDAGGSTVTGQSVQMIDSDSATASGSAQLRIVDFIDRPDNAIGDYARWVVRIHESHFTTANGV